MSIIYANRNDIRVTSSENEAVINVKLFDVVTAGVAGVTAAVLVVIASN